MEGAENTFQGTAGGLIQAKQRFIANILSKKPDTLYAVDDYPAMRKLLFDNVKKAVETRFPLYNSRYTLAVEGVDYEDDDEVDLQKQKEALLSNGSVTRRIRGSWVLKDAATGKEVSRTRPMTLAKVPYMTDRGTFIRNGHEYCFTNILRLEPGVYCKQKESEVAAQFNIQQGSGSGFQMRLIPSTGIFQMTRGTQNAPAYTVMHDLGVSDDDMKKAWGDELFEKNRAAGTTERAKIAAGKIYGN